MFRKYIAPVIIYVLYNLLKFTWKIEIKVSEDVQKHLQEGKPFLFAHWHGDELALVQLFQKYPISTIVSTSKDGEMMNGFVRLMGGKTTRGSSTRGGVGALKGLVKYLKSGYTCSFAVDGPKGPIYKVKPGIFELARILELPIFWLGTASSSAYKFPKSWNQTYIPKPFSKVFIEWHGSPLFVHKDTDPRDQKLAADLETKLHAAKQQALNHIADTGLGC